MRLESPLKLSLLLQDCPHEYAELELFGISDPKKFEPGDGVCCFELHELTILLSQPSASQIVCIIGPILEQPISCSLPYVAVKRPRLALQKMLKAVSSLRDNTAPSALEIHPTALISPLACIEDNVSIGPYAVIGDHVLLEAGVRVGSHCIVEPFCHLKKDSHLDHHVVLKMRCKIGQRTYIQSHTTIGADGFGFERVGAGWCKIPHLSSVIIENDCFIGSHVAIAAGALNPTYIAENVIIDNHVQIAHHVSIGSGTAIAGCVGIAGSTSIGQNCLIGGGTKISGHLRIVDRVSITGMTMVTKSLLTSGVYSSGMPVDTNDSWKKKIITLNRLTKKEMLKNVTDA